MIVAALAVCAAILFLPASASASLGLLASWQAPEPFNGGSALTTSSTGEVIALGSTSLRKFDVNGNLQAEWNVVSGLAPEGARATTVAVDPNGNIYVDYLANVIRKYSAGGVLLATWGADTDRFQHPGPLATDAAGNVYVADDSGVQKLSPDGETLAHLQTLRGAAGLAIDPQGRLYVSASYSQSVFVYAPDGSLIARIGSAGDRHDQFDSLRGPGALSIDPTGNLWALDQGHDRALQFSPSNEYLGGCIPQADPWYVEPGYLTVDPEGALLFSLGSTVQRYGDSPHKGQSCDTPAPFVQTARIHPNRAHTARSVRVNITASRPGAAKVTIRRLRPSPRSLGGLNVRIPPERSAQLALHSRIHGHTLGPGRYIATTVMTDTWHNVSRPVRRGFSITDHRDEPAL
jgi:sugar lactone lactonase YvrE